MLNPLNSGFFAVELISHKLLRYAVPVMLLALFAANSVLANSSLLYAACLTLQLVFYAMAFCGWILERRGRRVSLLGMPMYFVLANLAAVIAFYKFLRGERLARWEPIRETQ